VNDGIARQVQSRAAMVVMVSAHRGGLYRDGHSSSHTLAMSSGDKLGDGVRVAKTWLER